MFTTIITEIDVIYLSDKLELNIIMEILHKENDTLIFTEHLSYMVN